MTKGFGFYSYVRLFLTAAALIATSAGARTAAAATVYCFGSDIAPRVQARIASRLRQADPAAAPCPENLEQQSQLTVLLLGDHPLVRHLLRPADLAAGGPEDFILRRVAQGNNVYYIARGQRSASRRMHSADAYSIGSHAAAYELLEELGFAFLHPLAPYIPAALSFPPQLHRDRHPYWPVRAWHLHTQHPLELTHLLNGWGPSTPEDEAGWQAQLPEWDSFLEWCIANKQNQVSWYLLSAASWQAFAESTERQRRLATLVRMAQQWGLRAGMTTPIAFAQQHAFTLIRPGEDSAEAMRRRITWLSATGLDFIELEMGFSEFTHPDDRLELDLLNRATAIAAEAMPDGIATRVKVHVSSSQKASHFSAPDGSGTLNFNFLPYYADQRLGVMAHTVQFYGLDDPAPTYGNQDFSATHRYMQWEAGRREVLFYPETAYWVSADVDVPLFLPLYAERRLHDLRLIAREELAGAFGSDGKRGSRIQGQVNFSSGWEWGYWLNDLVAARAAFDPLPGEDDTTALRSALRPLTRIFGDAQEPLTALLIAVIAEEKELLLWGRVDGKAPRIPTMRTGQAYLQGVDTWDDVAGMLGRAQTQPSRKGLVAMRYPLFDSWYQGPHYRTELEPLLAKMKERFADLARQGHALADGVPADARGWLDEINDALTMTALRAAQVYDLYAAVHEQNTHPFDPHAGAAPLAAAQQTLQQALEIARQRAAHYRVPAARIASWQYGPTAYHFGYLWTAGNLAYWRRDAYKVTYKPLSPCFLNFVDPIDVAHGEGAWDVTLPGIGTWDIAHLATLLGQKLPPNVPLHSCLNLPAAEPIFPEDYP